MKFCTAINCIDGPVQLPVIWFLQERFGVEHVDCITEPGPVRIFDKVADLVTLNSIYTRLNLSLKKQDAQAIAVCAHADCPANPVDDATQQRQLRRAVIFLKESYPEAEVIALWVDKDWTVYEI